MTIGDQIMSFKIVERPMSRGTKRSAEYSTYLETAMNGQAIKIDLDGRKLSSVRHVLSRLARSRGYRSSLEVSSDGAIIAWCYPAEESKVRLVVTPNGRRGGR
jgi:hypothetical protein